MFMEYSPNRLRGSTLMEALVAVVLLATFFASIFELNAVCLRYIDATKESVAALKVCKTRRKCCGTFRFHGPDQRRRSFKG